VPDRIIRAELLESDAYLDISNMAARCWLACALTVDTLGNMPANPARLARLWSDALNADDAPQQSVPDAITAVLAELRGADLARVYLSTGKLYLHLPRFRQKMRYIGKLWPLHPDADPEEKQAFARKYPELHCDSRWITEKRSESQHEVEVEVEVEVPLPRAPLLPVDNFDPKSSKSKPANRKKDKDNQALKGASSAPEDLEAEELAKLVQRPIPANGSNSASRLAMMESGAGVARDLTQATGGDPVASQRHSQRGPGIISAPLADKPPLTVKPRALVDKSAAVPHEGEAWKQTERGILKRAKELGVALEQGDKWGDVIARIEERRGIL
jgi:hypothetical protein